jgi:predicted DNA-binding transcriptional regulator AlpA
MAKKIRSNNSEAVAPPETTPPKPVRPFTRLLSRKEMLALLPSGVTYPTVWAWTKKGIWPAPVELGSGGRVGWRDNEVYDALDRLPRRYPKGSKKAGR